MSLLKKTLKTNELERQTIKVLVIPPEKTLFPNDKKNESNVLKDGRLKEQQVAFKDSHPEDHQTKVEKKNIAFIGNSMTKDGNTVGQIDTKNAHPRLDLIVAISF